MARRTVVIKTFKGSGKRPYKVEIMIDGVTHTRQFTKLDKAIGLANSLADYYTVRCGREVVQIRESGE